MDHGHYIPLRAAAMISLCVQELDPTEQSLFTEFTRRLTAVLHQRYHHRLTALLDAYHQVDPDDDVQIVTPVTAEQRVAARHQVEAELIALAQAANFTRISEEELDQAFAERSLVKVRMEIDPEGIDTVLFFRRGLAQRTQEQKSFFGLRRREVEFTSYAKVLVFVAFTDQVSPEHSYPPGTVLVKLFQNVPRFDLEMLYPSVRVKMRPLDKLLIGVPALLSGIVVVATKLLAPLGLLVLLVGFWVGLREDSVRINQTALVSLAAGFVAFGGYLVRQIAKFRNRKIAFMKTLSEHLYFRALATDAGVFHQLLGAAEASVGKETILAYHCLRLADQPLTASALTRRVQDWLSQHSDVPITFDTQDALHELLALRLIRQHGPHTYTALGLTAANAKLNELWQRELTS